MTDTFSQAYFINRPRNLINDYGGLHDYMNALR